MIEWLADLDGILLRRDALASGVEDKALARAVHDGRIVRLRQGAYALRPAWDAADRSERHRLLVCAVRQQYVDDPVALSHVSAGVLQGGPTWRLDLSAAHLTHLDGRGGRRSARIVHHHGRCLVGDITRHSGGWMTAPTRTALDIASNAEREPAVAVLDWYLHNGLTTVDDLAAGFNRMDRWPGTLALQIAVRLADPSAESVGETRTRLLLRDQHLPHPETQYEILHPSGRLCGRVDFAWPDRRTMLEFDGLEKYHRFRQPGETIEQTVIREKRREDQLRELTGWMMVRLTWADLAAPQATAARIRRAFRIAA